MVEAKNAKERIAATMGHRVLPMAIVSVTAHPGKPAHPLNAKRSLLRGCIIAWMTAWMPSRQARRSAGACR
jgi:hypothetical protein